MQWSNEQGFGPCSFDHCIVCTAHVYFVDRCSSFSPCSFDHCIVCTAYVYFVDRCSFFGSCSFDHCIVCTSRTHNTMVKRTRTKKRTTIYKVNISRTPLHCVYGLCLLCRSLFGPCSFVHCIVCTDYVYFVDRCSVLVRLSIALCVRLMFTL
jgi:hypothetical protein